MPDPFANDTEPGTDYAVWGFVGSPPSFDGGELAPGDHQPSARYIAEADGWSGDSACYEVSDRRAFEAAVTAAKLRFASLTELDSDHTDKHENE